MKTITEDIKSGKFKSCYLLYGDETYLVNQYAENLKKALTTDGDTMNYSYYSGKNADATAIIDQAETMPFFAEHRVIFVEDSGFFKNSADEMAEYMKNVPDYAVFIFKESQVDARTKMYKAVKAAGHITKFDKLKGDMLGKWVLSIIKKERKNITRSALNNFLSRNGDDMYMIKNELEKLFSYTLDKDTIDDDDVDAVCATQNFDHIFDMVDAITEGNIKKAMSLYKDLIVLKEPVSRILYMISRQYNILLQVKDLRAKGYDRDKIASELSLHPFVAKKTIILSENIKREDIKKAIYGCVNTDEMYKRGFIKDQIGVEMLIMELAS
ncbi:MAG: DNA polymerase III subunit delta [Eubacterium sp.]|nr:DNA polymerase III subunit delta [Eubacterium sp.]